MPIRNYPFLKFGKNDLASPKLWVRVINPDTNKAIKALAIVDTGATNCSFPASAALQLGHNIDSTNPRIITTASGSTTAHPHTTIVEILGVLPDGDSDETKVLFTIGKTQVDYTKGCKAFLLGIKDFLANFVLRIDYPAQKFSIYKPEPKQTKRKKQRRRR